MTKEDFLAVNSLLYEKDFDELDRLEFWMGYESKTKEHIPDDWLALTPAPFEEPLQRPGDTTDWDSFRRGAAKDILCAVLAGGIANGTKGFDAQKEELVNVTIGMADELIKQLKQQ